MSIGPVVCQHDPMTAQRFCLCDAACPCRVAGNCVTTSGDVIPAMKLGDTPITVDEKADRVYSTMGGVVELQKAGELLDGPTFLIDQHGFTLVQCEDDPNQKCACGAHTEEGQHEATAYCTSEMDRAYREAENDPDYGKEPTLLDPLPKGGIEVVPPERLRAELASWQDEITQDDD